VTDLASVYRDKSPSPETKAILGFVHFGIILLVLFLLFGSGICRIDTALGRKIHMASDLRRGVLAGAALLYFIRTLFTIFVFVRRRMPWSEVTMIAIWILIFDVLIAYFGGRNDERFGASGFIGSVLVVFGSFLNTGSEWQRHLWKRRLVNRGHLLTQGFFQYSRHINYFGDVILFVGWTAISGQTMLLAIPSLMLLGFIFFNLPSQDRYLAERYGEEYHSYAKRTAKLIPYLY
jgi:steroid 5-alpha reductase family enzyme